MENELLNIIPTLPYIENTEDINESTRVNQDLRLDAAYARKFLSMYEETFNVNISRFDFKKYFPKTIPALDVFAKLLYRKRILTLGEMEQAITYGKIDEETLAKIRENKQEMPPRRKLYFQGDVHFTWKQILLYVLAGLVFFILLSIASFFF
jgi:hypothetical protein